MSTLRFKDSPTTEDKPTPRDFRQEVTDSIIRLMEEGTAPWQKPWDATGSMAMPMNPTTGKPYRGGNALYLLAMGMKRGYDDPRWMTYKQAAENGWQVKKGEKGTQIEFWDVKPVIGDRPEEGSTGDDSGEGPQGSRLIHRVYTVFHASQIAGIPAFEAKAHTPFEAIEAGEKILTNSGAAIHHDQVDRAFYRRDNDSIHLPRREYFPDAPGYYGTALHELAHWTGHPSRLDRPTLNEAYRFGDTNYAREELRAELASVFLAAERGIPHQPDHHAAYVASWIRALKNDKNEIFRAAADAAKAADYLFALERGEETRQGEEIKRGEPGTHAERVTPASRASGVGRF
jgi:antirestriction protein ArdC